MNNRVLGGAALALSAFMIILGLPLEAPFAYEPLGPRAFPLLVAAIIAICGLMLVIQGGGQAPANPPGANLRIALMIAIVAVYALLFQRLGFIVATFFMVVAIGRLFGGRWLHVMIGGIAIGIGFFLLFDRVLDVVLPLGLLGDLL